MPPKTSSRKASPRPALASSTVASSSKSGKAYTPAVQSVFIRLWRHRDHFDMQVYFDAAGQDVMTVDKPLEVLGDGKGKIQFNFIPPTPAEPVMTGDLVIIAQTVRDDTVPRGQRKDTPFRHPFQIPVGKFYPTYYLPSPAGSEDPTNIKCALSCGSTGYVVGGTVDVRRAPLNQRSKPYKYSIVALCDGATQVAGIDPTVIINPR